MHENTFTFVFDELPQLIVSDRLNEFNASMTGTLILGGVTQ